MNNKELQFDTKARESMKKGIDLLANAVKITLGPKGRTVIIGRNGSPHVTKDGVTVAKEIQLRNQFENLGCQLLKEAAIKTCDEVGDATSTCIIFTQSLINEGIQLINEGYNPISLKNELETGLQKVIDYIKSNSTKIDGDIEKIRQIATISANNDEIIGNLIADAFNKITEDGVIVVEESTNNDTTVEIINGMRLADRGFLTSHFITNHEKNETVLEKCKILITDQKIHSIRDIIRILEIIVQSQEPLLLIAQDFDGDVLENLKMNVLNGTIKCIPIKCPNFGEYRKQTLQDLAILTGGNYISYDSGVEVTAISYEDLGTAGKVIVRKDNTTIMNGNGDAISIKKHINHIKDLIQKDTEVDNTFYKDRIARIIGGICIIKVGGNTEIEMRERKDRVDDAVCSTKAAIEEGYSIGGGTNYLNAANLVLDKSIYGEFILAETLSTILSQLLCNSGISELESERIIFDLLDNPGNRGYDCKNHSICNMIKSGIIDSTKSQRVALQNAVSIASLFLTTECMIVDEQLINII